MTIAPLLDSGRLISRRQLHWLRQVAGQAGDLGMPLFLVGGPVRDLLLERPVRDFDLVVEGDATTLGRKLARAIGGSITVHKNFLTATWSVQDPEAAIQSLDLITARSETYQHPGDLPKVTPSTINDDLQRRDFTINAMAVRLDENHHGEFLDPLGGRTDLERKSIRVLHPRSFLDDPTRMLRAVRYADRYGFEIEPDTLKLIDEEARSVLSRLSGERLRHEFDLIFEEANPSVSLTRLGSLDLLNPIHPALASAENELPSLKEPATELGAFPSADILSIRQMLGWACWLVALPSTGIDSIAERLAFPAALTRAARAASSLAAVLPSYADARPSRWTYFLDDLPALSVYAVWLVKHEQALYDYLATWRHVRTHTTGDDLKARGLRPGPEYQKILSRLRTAWLDGEVESIEGERVLLVSLLQNSTI
jgi:tRNA nucleotidyltransferase (CCA-adding enzyme)